MGGRDLAAAAVATGFVLAGVLGGAVTTSNPSPGAPTGNEWLANNQWPASAPHTGWLAGNEWSVAPAGDAHL